MRAKQQLWIVAVLTLLCTLSLSTFAQTVSSFGGRRSGLRVRGPGEERATRGPRTTSDLGAIRVPEHITG